MTHYGYEKLHMSDEISCPAAAGAHEKLLIRVRDVSSLACLFWGPGRLNLYGNG